MRHKRATQLSSFLAIFPSYLLAPFRAAEAGGPQLAHPETWGNPTANPGNGAQPRRLPARRGCHSGNNINKATCGCGRGGSAEPSAGRCADNGLSRASGQQPQGDSASAEERSERASRGTPWPATPPEASLSCPPSPRTVAHTRTGSAPTWNRAERRQQQQQQQGRHPRAHGRRHSAGLRGHAPGLFARARCSRCFPWTRSSCCSPGRGVERRRAACRRTDPRARRVQPAAEGGCKGRRSGQSGRPGTTHGEVGSAGGGTRCDHLGDPGDRGRAPPDNAPGGQAPAPRPARHGWPRGHKGQSWLRPVPRGPSPSCGPVKDSARRRGWGGGMVLRDVERPETSLMAPCPSPLPCSPAQALLGEVQFPLPRLVSAPGGILWRPPPPSNYHPHLETVLIIPGPIRYHRGFKII